MGWKDAPVVEQAKPKWAAAPEVVSEKPTPFVPSGEKPEPTARSEIFENPNLPGALAGNPVTRFALGAASPFIGAGQLVANLLGGGKTVNEGLRQLEQAKLEGRKGIGSEGFDWTEAAGTVFSPAFLAAVKAMPNGLTYLQKIMAGMGLGAASGATAPVTSGGEDFTREKAVQTATGAAVGAAVPAVTPLVTGTAKAAYNVVEPFLRPEVAKGRVYLQAAGDKVDEIINLLKANEQKVAGSAPTAGEAAAGAGSAEFSNLQKQAMDLKPTAYADRAGEQNAARIAALKTVGKDKAALESAERVRSAAAGPLYRAAREGTAPVDTGPILIKIDSLLEKNPGNRELVKELTNIRTGLEESGTDPQKVSSVLDGLKATLSNKDNAFIQASLTDIKNSLVKAIPGYERAQKVFAKGSEPINQMQIGQYLEKKLVPALSEDAKQKATVYANALQEAEGTIKKATGVPRFDELSKALTPDQMKVVTGVKEDLARGALFEDLARKGAKAAPDITTPAGDVRLTGMFSRAVTIANTIIGRLEGKINKRLASEIAIEMMNPPKVAESLAQAKARTSFNKAFAGDVEKAITQATLGGIQAAESQQ